jgi:hypothetical protein
MGFFCRFGSIETEKTHKKLIDHQLIDYLMDFILLKGHTKQSLEFFNLLKRFELDQLCLESKYFDKIMRMLFFSVLRLNVLETIQSFGCK